MVPHGHIQKLDRLFLHVCVQPSVPVDRIQRHHYYPPAADVAAECEACSHLPWHRKNHELRLERRQIGTQQHSSKISHGDSDDQDDGDESRATDDDDDAF